MDQEYEVYGTPKPINPKKEKQKKNIWGLVKVTGILLAIVILVFDSAYILNSGNESVITQFGRYSRTETTPGLKFKLPFIERRYNVDVSNIRSQLFGYANGPDGGYVNVESESLMLTGDENLVRADWAIQYRITNSRDYLFNVEDPDAALRVISEASYRRIVASHPLDQILTDGKDLIQDEIQTELQSICDKYAIGITVLGVQLQDADPPAEVADAFLDVTSAREEKTSKINEASRYENERLPVARGEAARLVNDAEGYKQSRINEAEGMVARYKAIEEQYRKNPSVTRSRLYFEMINEVLPNVKEIYIVDPRGNTLQFLPLNGSSASALPGSNANTNG